MRASLGVIALVASLAWIGEAEARLPSQPPPVWAASSPTRAQAVFVPERGITIGFRRSPIQALVENRTNQQKPAPKTLILSEGANHQRLKVSSPPGDRPPAGPPAATAAQPGPEGVPDLALLTPLPKSERRLQVRLDLENRCLVLRHGETNVAVPMVLRNTGAPTAAEAAEVARAGTQAANAANYWLVPDRFDVDWKTHKYSFVFKDREFKVDLSEVDSLVVPVPPVTELVRPTEALAWR